MSDPTTTRSALHFAGAQGREHAAILNQLVNDEMATVHDGEYVVPWATVYEVLGDFTTYGISGPDLGVPPIDDAIRVAIARDEGTSITDENFDIRIAAMTRHGTPFDPVQPCGPGPWWAIDGVGEVLAPKATYELMVYVAESRRHDKAYRSRQRNLEVLGDIRDLATTAGASLDVYLERTRVLRPKELLLDVRSVQLPGGAVVEVSPRFDGQPDGWLETFDKFQEPRSTYRIADGADYWEIVIDEPVRIALKAIKKLPGRRVVGSDASRWVPYSSTASFAISEGWNWSGPAPNHRCDPFTV